ncbi:MAG: hypothetical protein U9N87_00265 [Planctomycetota bacterium]|nr:hypothetical protein [Planctomycetota bacterium]
MFGQASFGDNIHFSTGGYNNISWTITMSGGEAVLSFTNNEIDTTEPSPDAAINDLIELPDMTLTNLLVTNIGGLDMVSATLIPIDPSLTINADVASGTASAGQVVMSANLMEGTFLSVGANFMAYSNVQDDLNSISHVAGYSDVIDVFAAANLAGYDVDLSFSGDASGSLSDLLGGTADGSVSGSLSGQITAAIPEPSTAVLCLGFLVSGVCLFRRGQLSSR